MKNRAVMAAVSMTLCFAAHAAGQPPQPAMPSLPPPEPATLGSEVKVQIQPVSNQLMAYNVATALSQSGLLQDSHIEVTYQNGVVELAGEVRSQTQRGELVRLVESLPNVRSVRDRMALRGAGVTRAQAVGPDAGGVVPTMQQAPVVPPAIIGDMPRRDGVPALSGVPQPFIPEPTPIWQGGPQGGMPGGLPGGQYQLPNQTPPTLPPYAWPTYAPYNNYARVAYPDLYPAEAFPFIGPMHPFPRVPPGWRSVNLSWNDGIWWYGRHTNGHDWWRVRYW